MMGASISWSIAFINAKRCVSCTSSQPVNASSLSNLAKSASSISKKLSVYSATYWWAAIIKPNVPQAGSLHLSPTCGFISFVITSIKTRGVKYWPAPDFFSLAFISSNPSYRFPSPSSLAEYQSRLSIVAIIFSRFLGSSIFVAAPWYISRILPVPLSPSSDNSSL